MSVIPDVDADVASFREGIRALLRSRDVTALTRDRMADGAFDRSLWDAAAGGLGAQALLVPEERGGAGVEVGAAVAFVDEVEGALAPGPFRSTMLAAHALSLAAGLDTHLEALLGGGRATVVRASLPAAGQQAQDALHGLVVPHAGSLDVLVLLDPATATIGVVTADDPALVRHDIEAFDLTRPSSVVDLGGAAVDAVPLEAGAVERIVDLGHLLVVAEQRGVVRSVVERTISYCRDRHAFGRSVASFQALKHELALLWCELERGTAVLDRAVAAVADDGPHRRRDVLAARATLGPAAVRVASEGLRLRGGIGYTWEDDSHLFFRRARALEHDSADPYALRHELRELLDLTR